LLTYIQVPWPENPVPEGEPVWLFYEVDEAQDNVLRSVERFADGRLVRNSTDLETRDGWPCVSLFHGSFRELTVEVPLQPFSGPEFEALWKYAQDKPLS
jgi:hypothetical protein